LLPDPEEQGVPLSDDFWLLGLPRPQPLASEHGQFQEEPEQEAASSEAAREAKIRQMTLAQTIDALADIMAMDLLAEEQEIEAMNREADAAADRARSVCRLAEQLRQQALAAGAMPSPEPGAVFLPEPGAGPLPEPEEPEEEGPSSGAP
jgi:hypothetical protein